MTHDKEALETHRRTIANLGTEGLSNTVEQRFERVAGDKEKKIYKGFCSICKMPFGSGYAVRCSDSDCEGLIFHPSCFGSHAMAIHQPASVSVIMRETANQDVFEYVDVKDTSKPHTPTLEKAPHAADLPIEPTPGPAKDVVISINGEGETTFIQPDAESEPIPLPSSDDSATIPTEDEEAMKKRQKRVKRTKKRLRGR
ncbi:MAG: hypothetical protein PVG65_03350 [Candidatus Thorarchaeota archaeon]|jgi:hypothetical protein